MHHLNISLNSCVFFFRNPSTYIYECIFLISYHTFSPSRAFVHEEHRWILCLASPSRLLYQRWTLILYTGHKPHRFPPFSISHPLSSYVFDAIHFFCRHRTTAAAVAKRNEPPRTLLFLAFTSTRNITYIYFQVREWVGKKIMSNLIFFLAISAYAARTGSSQSLTHNFFSSFMVTLYAIFSIRFMSFYFYVVIFHSKL